MRNALTRVRFSERLGARYFDVLTEYGFCRIYPDYKSVSWEVCGIYPMEYSGILDLVKTSLWDVYKHSKPKNGLYYDPWLECWFRKSGFWKFEIVENNKYIPPERKKKIVTNGMF